MGHRHARAKTVAADVSKAVRWLPHGGSYVECLKRPSRQTTHRHLDYLQVAGNVSRAELPGPETVHPRITAAPLCARSSAEKACPMGMSVMSALLVSGNSSHLKGGRGADRLPPPTGPAGPGSPEEL